MTKRELALSIADHGGWEEFHQKRGNFTMYDYHKAQRLKLEKEYKHIERKIPWQQNHLEPKRNSCLV